MPNPRYNKLNRPIKLSIDNFDYIYNKVFEYVNMWIDWKNYQLKPWEVKGKIYTQDINALNMLERMSEDAEKYREAKERQKSESQQQIRNELNAGKH